MSKYSAKGKLSKEERDKLLLELCQALTLVKSLEESARLLVDLFSQQEIDMIAKRLRIAKLLIRGLTYKEVADELKVSSGTIARVNAWLHESGEGFRFVVENGKDVDIPKMKPMTEKAWSTVARRYPAMFWPQLVLEEIVHGASNKQRERLLSVMEQVRKSGQQKSKLFKQLDQLLKKQKQ